MRTRHAMLRLLAVMSAGALLLAACGDDSDSADDTTDTTAAPAVEGGGEGGGEASSGETFTIRLPHHMAENTIDQECITEWADAVTERSGGRLEFEITPAGALGGESDVEQNVF